MTNEEIIRKAAVEAGIYTQAEMEGIIAAGEALNIHTISRWNRLGYKVKKGEHAAIKTKLWNKVKKTDSDGSDPEEKENSPFEMHPALLFTEDQVEPSHPGGQPDGKAEAGAGDPGSMRPRNKTTPEPAAV